MMRKGLTSHISPAPLSAAKAVAGQPAFVTERKWCLARIAHYGRSVLIWFIFAYKKLISPLLPPSCRFYPTCSDYARGAIEEHGAFRGVILAAWRLLRCHPFHPGGYDPPPAGQDTNKTAPIKQQ